MQVYLYTSSGNEKLVIQLNCLQSYLVDQASPEYIVHEKETPLCKNKIRYCCMIRNIEGVTRFVCIGIQIIMSIVAHVAVNHLTLVFNTWMLIGRESLF